MNYNELTTRSHLTAETRRRRRDTQRRTIVVRAEKSLRTSARSLRLGGEQYLLLALIFLLVIVGGFFAPMSQAQSKPKRPNIIFIQTDDQAAWALGVSGNAQARTPNLDRLFRGGAYLRNAFVSTPVCSPSRAALMTSRYGTELGITDWINPNLEPQLGLSPGIPTWPKLLADNGYYCGLIGKWHLGTQPQFDPARFGFKYFMGFRAGGTAPKDPPLDVDGQVKKVEGFVVDIVTDDALRFVREHRGENFLLMLNYREPHAPYLPVHDEDWAKLKDLDPQIHDADYPDLDLLRAKRLMREYLASVHAVDRNVGRLLALLDELQLSQDTVVVFTSDHGYNIGQHGIWHKGNGHLLTKNAAGMRNTDPSIQRPNLFDTSLRTPTAVRWPRVIKAGTEIKNTTSNLDWFPTMLSIAGIKPPVNATLRGRDILPLLKGRRVKWDDDFYVEYSQHHYTKTQLRAYRTPEWKLIRDFLNPGKDELYHLAVDPDEHKNLIADPSARAIKEKLDAKLQARRRTVERGQ
jgi:choline-sulfatase